MTTITCKLPEVLSARLDSLARGQRRTKSALLREILEERLNQQEPQTVYAYDLVKHLCGTLKGGPTDLATNPEYMNGFGE